MTRVSLFFDSELLKRRLLHSTCVILLSQSLLLHCVSNIWQRKKFSLCVFLLKIYIYIWKLTRNYRSIEVVNISWCIIFNFALRVVSAKLCIQRTSGSFLSKLIVSLFSFFFYFYFAEACGANSSGRHGSGVFEGEMPGYIPKRRFLSRWRRLCFFWNTARR